MVDVAAAWRDPDIVGMADNLDLLDVQDHEKARKIIEVGPVFGGKLGAECREMWVENEFRHAEMVLFLDPAQYIFGNRHRLARVGNAVAGNRRLARKCSRLAVSGKYRAETEHCVPVAGAAAEG